MNLSITIHGEVRMYYRRCRRYQEHEDTLCKSMWSMWSPTGRTFCFQRRLVERLWWNGLFLYKRRSDPLVQHQVTI